MTIKRFILGILTLLVVLLVGTSLLQSWTKPQVQSRLELYQTDLLLQASAWNSPADDNLSSVSSALVGSEPVETALKQYQEARESAADALAKMQQASAKLNPVSPQSPVDPELGGTPVRRSPQQQTQRLMHELDLRLGVLYAKQNQRDEALKTWNRLTTEPSLDGQAIPLVQAAEVLTGLWSNPPQLLPDAEQSLQQTLNGWFRTQALAQLYQLQQRQDALAQLRATEQQSAEAALFRLTLVGAIPVFGSLIGSGLLIGWVIQQVRSRRRFLSKREALSPDSTTDQELSWVIPWGGETIWQVMVLWFTAFFGISVFVLPLTVAVLQLNPASFDAQTQAWFAFSNYAILMAVGFTILYLCLKPFLPLPKNLFRVDWRGNWLLWGVGGYLAALPLVILVSLLNQRLLENQGGANPILEIILQSRSQLTMIVLFAMVAVLAPVFEETLFRGFFLPSLIRYVPTWGAIAISGFVFAIAHLNLADILPLTVLGIILGTVYARSQNLLASILLHSIWNSGSFLGLLILGGSNS